ncbi:helix-turn-helix transcriptional regulator [Comamonas sp. JC664]|uniref:helix-turn-helix transcriptional regulator n=1 Tax=Comamonas sp. JC664 TaxID=2801917 RepID=UPI00174A5AE7|nr:helix-turn-helix transcriptional regulator [Comamonas sp. JC664]MBL0694395.1 helix-turn-helix transcriptional regulator [Comamonas sp. JC664]GHG77390.1 transcriptional regulator [Comamonas sp. KCTC 72670]
MPRAICQEKVLESIYDCAENPSGFEPALALMASCLRADKAHALIFHDGRLIDSCFHGYDDSGFEEYERHWQAKDPRFSASLASPGTVLSDEQVMEAKRFESSPIYNELLKKVGVRYTLFTTTELAPTLVLGQAFMKNGDQGPFAQSDVRSLDRVMPHLRRAFRMQHLITALTDELADLRRALDVVPSPIALLESDGRLICGNEKAHRLFTAGDGLYLDARQLTARSSLDAKALAAAFSQAAMLADCRPRQYPASTQATMVQVSRKRGGSVGVVLLPARSSNPLRARGHAKARVIAVFHDPSATLLLDPKLISRLHGLTRTEALLAFALAQGQSLAEFAVAQECSVQTARTHLKRVLDKTGAHRQAELVRILVGSAALHSVPL